MSLPSNQEIEKYYFEQFAKDFPLPSGILQYGDKPDVIIRGAKNIGIEIANFYLADGADEASEQVQRKRREKVIRLAEADYKSKRNLNYEFNISFNPKVPIIEVKSVATKLVDFILLIENTIGNFFTSNAFNISPEIYSVHRSQEEYPDAKWKITQVFESKNLQVTKVREIVQKKNEKISGYIHCDSYWRLLVVDFMDSAQDQEIEWPTDESPIECKYKKVIIYKPQFKRYSDIPVNHIYC
jgi:hypothetical protein